MNYYVGESIRYVVIPVLVLFYWRGAWYICDEYFYPDNIKLSFLTSLVSGYIGIILMNLIRLFMTSKYNKWYKWAEKVENNGYLNIINIIGLIAHKIQILFVGFFVVNAWRGLWLFQDIYLLPEDPVLSAWTSTVVGTITLILFCSFQSVYAPPAILMTDFQDALIPTFVQKLWDQTEGKSENKDIIESSTKTKLKQKGVSYRQNYRGKSFFHRFSKSYKEISEKRKINVINVKSDDDTPKGTEISTSGFPEIEEFIEIV